MGSKTIVYGFIELDPQFNQENRQAFDACPFDAKYPFTNIFGTELPGYESSTVSFAGTFKSLIEDWDEWEIRFDQLLASLYCRSATVRMSDDVHGEFVIKYVCDDGWETTLQPYQRRWKKWKTDFDGLESEENHLRQK